MIMLLIFIKEICYFSKKSAWIIYININGNATIISMLPFMFILFAFCFWEYSFSEADKGDLVAKKFFDITDVSFKKISWH